MFTLMFKVEMSHNTIIHSADGVRRIVLALLLTIVSITPFRAYCSRPSDANIPTRTEYIPASHWVTLCFRPDGDFLYRVYMGNDPSLARLDSLFDGRGGCKIDAIMIFGHTSPFETSSAAQNLAQRRAIAARQYMRWKHPDFDFSHLSIMPSGDSWDALRAALVADENIAWRDEAIDIIDNTKSSDQRRAKLLALNDGRAYDYLCAKVLPQLCSASILIVCSGVEGSLTESADRIAVSPACDQVVPVEPKEKIVESVESDTMRTACQEPTPSHAVSSGASESVAAADTVDNRAATARPVAAAESATLQESGQSDGPKRMALAQRDEPLRKSKPVFAVKTNLLFDAALTPSLELEFYMGRRLSVDLELFGGWWDNAEHNTVYHACVAGPELRVWLRPYSFTGSYFGIYADAGYFDLGNSQKSLRDGRAAMAGLSWGYMLPVGRHFAVEFALAAGVAAAEYDIYEFYKTDWAYTARKRTVYTGLTKAKIDLVWRF